MVKKVKYSIPFNGNLKLMNWAINSGQISEVYFSGPLTHDFADPKEVYQNPPLKKIIQLIKTCNNKNITTNLLLNKRIMFFEKKNKIKNLINKLEEYGKVDTITIGDPFILEFLSKEFPQIKLQASIFLGIDSYEKVKEALKMGITTICLDPSLNRKFNELKKINRLKKHYPFLKLKLLGCLNCYSNCFFAWEHPSIAILHKALARTPEKDNQQIIGNDLNADCCFFKVAALEDNIKKPFIRPEDVKFYENNDIIDEIKIAYREENTNLLQKKMRAYFNRSFKGDLFELIASNAHKNYIMDNKRFPSNFIEKVTKCDKVCEECGYCKNLAKKVLIKDTKYTE